MKKQLLFAALAAALLAGCSKENTDAPEGGTPMQGEFVSVTLPLAVTDAEPASAAASGATTSPVQATATASKAVPGEMLRSAAATSEGFSVSFGEPTPATATDASPATHADAIATRGNTATDASTASHAAEATATRGNTATDASPATHADAAPGSPATHATEANPATRTMAQALSNVWVLQFDASGKNVSTTRTPTLAAGAHLTPTLVTGTGCTIYVVANGPASGLTTSNPATLADFEAKMLATAAVTDAAQLPLAGKLTGVTVVNLGGGKGKISVKESAPPMVTMNRIHAEVTLAVDFAVADYTLTGAQLYNVPVGATYGWNSATTTFPDNATAANFGYRSTAAAGLTPLSAVTSGTKTTYKWFVGDNRRGDVASLAAPSDRHSTNAPAYATFARITLTNSTTASQKIMYDIYLGSGAVTNFDVKRNMTYTFTAAIKGTAAFQEALIGVDARVSSVGIPIYLTNNKADSPFVISPKSMESTATMKWGPTSSIPAAQDVYNGKANTDAIMATNATAYLAAKHCRDQGAAWNLPAQAQLMLMWIYLDAIPAADRPASGAFWSSTEGSNGTSNAWGVNFSGGGTGYYAKGGNYSVRCVRDGVKPAFGSWEYPKVEGGNTIVSRDAAGGIKSAALLTTDQKTFLMNQTSQPIYNETSQYNKVSAKFQVASADASSSTWIDAYDKCKSYSQSSAAAGSWRVPTQRELMLIWMFKAKLTSCGNITTASGYFWSSTELINYTSSAWRVSFSNGSTSNSGKTNANSVRCVRDL